MSMIRPSEHAREIISNDYEQKHSGESIDSDRTTAINMENRDLEIIGRYQTQANNGYVRDRRYC